MNKKCPELLSSYIDGELTEKEREQLEQHCRECESCAALLQLYREMSQAAKTSCVQAPEELRTNVMSEIFELNEVMSDAAVGLGFLGSADRRDMRKQGPGKFILSRRIIPLAACLAVVIAGYFAISFLGSPNYSFAPGAPPVQTSAPERQVMGTLPPAPAAGMPDMPLAPEAAMPAGDAPAMQAPPPGALAEERRDNDEPDEMTQEEYYWEWSEEADDDADVQFFAADGADGEEFYARITIDGPLPDDFRRFGMAVARIDDFTIIVTRTIARELIRRDDLDISIEYMDADAEYAIVHWSP